MNSNSRATVSNGYQITDRRAYLQRLYTMLGIGGPARINRTFRERVKEIQSSAGTLADGIVDYMTFRLIVEQYKNPSSVKIHQYDGGDDILRLNTDIARLCTYYSLPVRRPRGRFFGVDSMRAAAYLRTIYRLPVSDSVDDRLLQAIRRDIRSINAIKG